MVISTGRKKPHCRTCGLPMEGHKRNGRAGSPLCPTQSSPHVKPPLHQPFALPQYASAPPQTDFKFKTRETPSTRQALVIPESGPWHWRNPNWIDRHRPIPPRPSSPVGSLVPTVLVDSDGHTIAPERSHKRKSPLRREETTSVMLMDRLAAMGKPAVSIYNTKLENVSRMKSAADKLGFHSGVVHKPADVHPRDVVEKEEDENEERVENYSWWLVMGQSSTAVQQVVDSQQRGIPGAISDAREMVSAPKVVTTFQLVLAGVVGALFVVCVLSML
ncbi:hypothetical protein JOM56_008909 [Amanita muscaria]